jgi:TetR/AcrR family transcriptional regulator, copper-responsive repressor
MEETRRRGRPVTFDRAIAISVVTEMFWRHGYEGTTLAMLTDALGVTAPTLYAAFGSKDQLYRAALANYRRPDEAVARNEPGPPSIYELVEQFLREKAFQFAGPSRPKGCMVASGMLRGGSEATAAAEATAEVRREALGEFVAMIERSRREGELQATVDCEALARFYTAVIQGMSVQAIDGADTNALHGIVDLALSVWPITLRSKIDQQAP